MLHSRYLKYLLRSKGCSIKTIRNDRGVEYTSKKFEEYCKNEGIKKQLTAGYTPQQNGVSEEEIEQLLKWPEL